MCMTRRSLPNENSDSSGHSAQAKQPRQRGKEVLRTPVIAITEFTALTQGGLSTAPMTPMPSDRFSTDTGCADS